jgi:uncharacterized protein YmfQ (DUF2313 family)
MNHAELLKRLLPPVAYDGNGTVISAELNAEGDVLDAALLMADKILSEADPRTTYSMLSDWERVAGLSALNLSLGQRHSILTAKLASRGG